MQGLGNLFGSKHGYKVLPNQVNTEDNSYYGLGEWKSLRLMLDFDAGIGGPGCEQLDRLLHVLSSHVGVPLQKSCSGAALTSFSTYRVVFFNWPPPKKSQVLASK